MKSYAVPALVAIAALALAAYGYLHVPTSNEQGVTQATSTVTQSFESLASGTAASVELRANYVITTQADLSKLWQMIPDAGPQPDVDFTKYDVLAIFAGQKPTAGYKVSVTKITDSDKRAVYITLTNPDSTCLLAQSLTSPYEIVKVSHTDLPLTHFDTTARVGCLPQ